MTKTTQIAARCKRWTPTVNAVLVTFVLVVPTLVILFGGRIGEQPAVWIKTAVAGVRRGETSQLVANCIFFLAFSDLLLCASGLCNGFCFV
jgi:hypothetical protein